MTSTRSRAVVSFRRKGERMDHCKTDAAGVPIIEGVNAKIGVLERRREYLTNKLERGAYARTSSSDFDRHEVSAIGAAVRALRFHAATLRPDLDPVVHLARVVRAAQRVLDDTREEVDGQELTANEQALEKALADAGAALNELG